MDPSTVKMGHALLTREFELNNGTAPSIYRSVLSLVRKADGALALDGSVAGDASAAGYEFVGFWRESPTRTRLSRVAARDPDASDADGDVVEHRAGFDPRPVNWHRIDTDKAMDAVTDAVLALQKLMRVADRAARRGNHVGQRCKDRKVPWR